MSSAEPVARLGRHRLSVWLVAGLLVQTGCAPGLFGLWPLRPRPLPIPPPGAIHGSMVLPWLSGGEDPRPIVVYLEPAATAGVSGRQGSTARARTVRAGQERFSPSFLVVAVKQRVRFLNDGPIYHRFFSYSGRNSFDLGVSGSGESRSIRFQHLGVVRVYCSLHESESGTVFVAPTLYFDTVQASGAFRIGNVPPGRYRLRTWSAAGPLLSRDVTVRPRVTASVRLGAQDEWAAE